MVAVLKIGGGCDRGVQKGDEQRREGWGSSERQRGHGVNGKGEGGGWTQGGGGWA